MSRNVPLWIVLWLIGLSVLSVATFLGVLPQIRQQLRSSLFGRGSIGENETAVRQESGQEGKAIPPASTIPQSSTIPPSGSSESEAESLVQTPSPPAQATDAQQRYVEAFLASEEKEIVSGKVALGGFWGAYVSCIGRNHWSSSRPFPLQDVARIFVSNNLAMVIVADGVSGDRKATNAFRQATRDLAEMAVEKTWGVALNQWESKRDSLFSSRVWKSVAADLVTEVSNALDPTVGKSEKPHPSTTLSFALCTRTPYYTDVAWLAVGDSSLGLVKPHGVVWLTPHDVEYLSHKDSLTDAMPWPGEPISQGVLRLMQGEFIFACSDGVAPLLHLGEDRLTDLASHRKQSVDTLEEYLRKMTIDCASKIGDDSSIAILARS